MKRTIKLTESELRNMIYESVKRVLNEKLGDNVKTKFAYAKNMGMIDYLSPIVL